MEQAEKKKRGRGSRLIVFIGIIAAAFFVVQRVTLKDERQLYGRWQMTDESWETELKYRESYEGELYSCFYKCVSFSGPDAAAPLKARFVAFDNGLKPPHERISGTFTYNNDEILCLAFGAAAWEVEHNGYERADVEWVDFNTIVVRNHDKVIRSCTNPEGEERTYRRISKD